LRPLLSLEGAVNRNGEIHSKGSEAGMIAIMVQATSLSHEQDSASIEESA